MPKIDSVPPMWLDSLRTSEVDATVWQVFGDWLLEHGDERGHLVLRRYEVMNELPSSRKRIARWQQVTAAHETHQSDWLAERAVPPGLQLQWRDGFVVGVTVTTIGRTTKSFFDSLVSIPTGAFLQRLTWKTSRPVTHLTAYLPEPLLCHLTTLEWRGSPLDQPSLAKVVTHPPLAGLAVLDLQHAVREPSVMNALAASILTGLRTLAIGSNPIGDDGIDIVAQCPALATLEALFSGYAHIGDRGAQALVSTPVLNRLRVLSLRGNAISPALQSQLASSTQLPHLETLHLHGQVRP